ncbi:hypothetical protein HK100_004349, partial [Physocladia obscura]
PSSLLGHRTSPTPTPTSPEPISLIPNPAFADESSSVNCKRNNTQTAEVTISTTTTVTASVPHAAEADHIVSSLSVSDSISSLFDSDWWASDVMSANKLTDQPPDPKLEQRFSESSNPRSVTAVSVSSFSLPSSQLQQKPVRSVSMPNASYKGRHSTQPANTPSPLGLNMKRTSTDEHVLLAKSWASKAHDSPIPGRKVTSPSPTPTSFASPKTAKQQASKTPATKLPATKLTISYSQVGRKNNRSPVRDSGSSSSSSEESVTSNTDSESDDDRRPLFAVARPGTPARPLVNGHLNPTVRPYGFYALPHVLPPHAYNLNASESGTSDTGRNSLPPPNFPLVNLSESDKSVSINGRSSTPVNESGKIPFTATAIFPGGGRNSPSPGMYRTRSESHGYDRSLPTQLSQTQQAYTMQQNTAYTPPWYPSSRNGSFLTSTPPLAPSSSQAGSDNGRGGNGSEFSFSSQQSTSSVSRPLVYIEGITPPEFRLPPQLPPHLMAPPAIMGQMAHMPQFPPGDQQPSRDALLEYMRFHQQMATQAYEAFQMQMQTQQQNQYALQQSQKSDDKVAKLLAIPTPPPSKEKKPKNTKKAVAVSESPSSDGQSDSSTNSNANFNTISVNPYLNSEKLVIRVDSRSSLGSTSSSIRRDGPLPPSILRSASTGQQLPMKKKGVSFDATALVGDSERGLMMTKKKQHKKKENRRNKEDRRGEKKKEREEGSYGGR